MSFRDLRNFTEVMRVLGYPRLISIDNFRTPNFALVADILYWLVHRFDPHSRISDEIETEKDRIYFVTQVAQSMASHAHLKLNCKKLYAADGHAVRELLKVAKLLKKAKNLKESKEEDEDDGTLHATPAEIDQTRTLGEEITESGFKLNALLENEDENKEEREKALRFLDATRDTYTRSGGSAMDYVKSSIQGIIMSVSEQVDNLEKQCEEFAHDERKVSKEIRKKRTELERHEKRLKSLESVRPAFMDEYEKLEVDLKREYEVYLEKFRNLDYLENKLDELNKAEMEKIKAADRALKRMQARLRANAEPDPAFLETTNDEPAADKKESARPADNSLRQSAPVGEGDMLGGSETESTASGSETETGSSTESDSESWGQVSLQNSESETGSDTDSETGSGSESGSGSYSGSESSGEF